MGAVDQRLIYRSLCVGRDRKNTVRHRCGSDAGDVPFNSSRQTKHINCSRIGYIRLNELAVDDDKTLIRSSIRMFAVIVVHMRKSYLMVIRICMYGVLLALPLEINLCICMQDRERETEKTERRVLNVSYSITGCYRNDKTTKLE